MRRSLRRDEEGATIAIVAISLIALMGMVVLTVDVGGLVSRRREMVNANDAAALAAAKAFALNENGADCGVNEGPALNFANALAAANVDGSNLQLFDADCPNQTVTVEYDKEQDLFFAPVLGFGDTATVTATATAKWGQSQGGNPIPIEIDPTTTGNCVYVDPDDPEGGFQQPQVCPDGYWFDPQSTDQNSAWGLLSLNEWAPENGANDPQAQCSAAGGSNDLAGWIDGSQTIDVRLSEIPTYVCTRNGASTSTWFGPLQNEECPSFTPQSYEQCRVFLFPINDPAQMVVTNPWLPTQIEASSTNREKYAIVAFAPMVVYRVLDGDDPEAIGTPAVTNTGQCSDVALGNSGAGDPNYTGGFGGWDLAAFARANCGAPATGTPVITNVSVSRFRPPGPRPPALVQCTSPGQPVLCDWYFNPSNNILSWWNLASKDARNTVSFSWSVNVSAGTEGACGDNGIPPSSPASRAFCLQLAWAGPQLIGQDPGPPGAGFGAQAVTLIK